MITGAQTWRGALLSLFQQINQAFLQQLVIQPFQQWVAMQARMLAAKLGFVHQEQAMDAAASATAVAQKSAETTAVVSMDAAKAGAGAAASQASIPYVGPALAVAAMVAMVAAVMALLGNVKKFASGGLVTGPGNSTSDSIPARLSAGEFVMNAAAVKRVGVDFLQAINGLSAGPRVQGPTLAFAAGGLVPDTAPQASASNAVRIVNVIDPAMAADYARAGTFPIREEPFTLTNNCRNTAPIHVAAYKHYKGVPVSPPDIEGDEVQFEASPGRDAQAAKINARVVDLVARQGVSAGDITVLIADALRKADYYAALRRLPLPKPATWLEEGIRANNTILIDTIQRFKGLESPIVILWGLDTIDLTRSEELLYVGMSRAKSLLIVVGTAATCAAFEGATA